VSHSNANYEAIPLNIRGIFKPLFDELAALDEPLSKEEFVDAANRLYDTLS